MNREELIAEIATYSELTHDWDGDGASEISSKCIDAATSFVSSLNMDYADIEVAPSPEGEIVVYWRDDDDVYIEVNFNAEGLCDVQHVDPYVKKPVKNPNRVIHFVFVSGLRAAIIIFIFSF